MKENNKDTVGKLRDVDSPDKRQKYFENDFKGKSIKIIFSDELETFLQKTDKLDSGPHKKRHKRKDLHSFSNNMHHVKTAREM
jgi:hypothetical protein